MNAKLEVLNVEEPVSIAPSSTPRREYFWQPTAEFVLTIALLLDAVVIYASLCLGYWVRFSSGMIPLGHGGEHLIFADYFNLLAVGTSFLVGTFCYLRLYSRRIFKRFHLTAKVLIQGAIFWFFAYMAVSLILKFDPPISRAFMVSSSVCLLVMMLGWRYLLFKITHWEALAFNLRQRVLFVGWGKEADQLEKEISEDDNHPYTIVGCVPSPQGRLHTRPPETVPVLGDYQNLVGLLERRQADIVILADLYAPMGEIIGLVNLCEMEFAQFKVIPSYFQILASGLRLESISGVPVLGVGEMALDYFSNRVLKRMIDLVGALVGMAIAAPLIAIFGFLVYRESPGSIFYCQHRTGRNGKSFKMYKIRSMRLDAETAGAQWCKENDPRRLKVGAFMRKWNIDEVPQFWNVLKGDMSLVGPRPERPELISQFKYKIPHYHARHTCLPGMTGWAQVNGWRGNTSLEERIRYDIWYVENWSVGLDFRIMMMTFLKQKNAY